MTRAAELGAQYATVEEILEQPAPLGERLVLLGVVAVDTKHAAPFRDDDELFVENLGDLIAVRLALAGVAGRR